MIGDGLSNRLAKAGSRMGMPFRVLTVFLILLVFQVWAYTFELQLSLGPRVIMQPWLLGRGFVMYENIADLHSPLMPLLIAALTPLIPDGLILAKLILITLLSLSTVLTFVAGYRKIGWLGGLGAACFFMAWAPAFGFGKLWYESFLTPLYLLLFLCYDQAIDPRPVKSGLLIGFICGLAILFKQHAVIVAVALFIWSALNSWYSQRSIIKLIGEIGLMSFSAMLPISVYLVYQFFQAGSLASFLFWTIGYTLTGNYKSLAVQWPTWTQIGLMTSCGLLLPAALWGVFESKRRQDKTWFPLGLGLILLITGSGTAYPRFELMHLQAVLPILALVTVMTTAYFLRRGIPVGS